MLKILKFLVAQIEIIILNILKMYLGLLQQLKTPVDQQNNLHKNILLKILTKIK